MAPDFPEARGFLIFGTPPVALPPMGGEFLASLDSDAVFAERLERNQAAAFVASLFAPGFADYPPFFVEDVLRTDGRARKFLGASLRSGLYRDEVAVVHDLKAPLAVLHTGPRSSALAVPILCLARHTDFVARRGADGSRCGPRTAMGDARNLQRAARGVRRGNGVKERVYYFHQRYSEAFH